MKLKKGDSVKVIKGKDKGKTGKIEKVFPARNKVLVEGMNQYKRHLKAKAQNQKSEIIKITKPLFASSVALICPKCNKLSRIGYIIAGREKYRVCRKCKEKI
ncbi:MAG: 50S ribosomal protein L24 [Candidatus Levybacteria bacterium RIFCSPHIGHO2_01_FULL_36_15]|nr:MAG: 50S ribosomal protein L24 [Candidatus Levybacteria bacterium RIFCSPHIGHO2_01_FULL_36_15]OGH38363.1 MAG: 50S ribosomal protein L24 [Candidatus Levybacteria bacterium RIFCSPLOWO2_01_FULL_36_10]